MTKKFYLNVQQRSAIVHALHGTAWTLKNQQDTGTNVTPETREVIEEAIQELEHLALLFELTDEEKEAK